VAWEIPCFPVGKDTDGCFTDVSDILSSCSTISSERSAFMAIEARVSMLGVGFPMKCWYNIFLMLGEVVTVAMNLSHAL